MYMEYEVEDIETPKKRPIVTIICIVIIAIVILAIILHFVIGGSNKSNTSSASDSFVSNANKVVDALVADAESNNYEQKCYNLNNMNNILENKLSTSPYKKNYVSTSYVLLTKTLDNMYSYEICLLDEGNNGIKHINVASMSSNANISKESLSSSSIECVLPTSCQ